MGDLTRYFEDFAAGDEFETGQVAVSEADILDYARRFDPQPFHRDPEEAQRTDYGGLIASGFHTAALSFRLFLETGLLAGSSLGSPGLDDIRWIRPVRPGDTLRVTARVTATRASTSRADRGVVTLAYTTLNQRGEVVMSMLGRQLIRRRPQ